MRILITGASGFLGGHVAERFAEAGHGVRALVRTTSDTRRLERLGAELVRGDLKDPDSLRRAVRGADAVVHAASTMGGVPAEYEKATIEGTRALLEAAEAAGVRRFVYVSSISVYPMSGPKDGGEIAEERGYEQDPLFLSDYVRSKIGGDRAALEFAEESDMEVVVLRPGILYGPRGRWNISRMGYPFGRNFYVVVGNGRTELPVCYVKNCADAVRLAATREAVEQGAYNVVDDERFAQAEYLERLKAEVRPRMRIVRFPYLAARAIGGLFGLGMSALGRSNPFHPGHMIACRRELRYSNRRAKEKLGWQPQVGPEEALRETMQYFAEKETVSRRADLGRLGKPVEGAEPLTACVIGCGMIAEAHLKALTAMPHAKVLAVCDLDEELARETADRFGVPASYGDAERMLEAEAPDVVHVLTPPQSHLALVEAAAGRGCHVLVEKPMARDAAEARRMQQCAERHGVQLCVDHNHLYDPAMVEARRLAESGALGEVVWVESYYGFDLASNPASRYRVPGAGQHWTFDLPGGLYQNLAPHPVSVALDLIGPPERVEARAQPSRVVQHQPTDELRAMLSDGKAGGLVTVSLAASPRFQYLDIHGTRMRVTVDFLNKHLVCERVIKGLPKAVSRALINLGRSWTLLRGTLSGMWKVLTGRWTPYEGIDILVREYYSALQAGREPPVTAQEAIAVMEAMDRMWDQIGRQDGARADREWAQIAATGGS